MRPRRAASARGPWAASLALLLTWSLLYAPQLFQGRVFVIGDAGRYAPFAEFSRERWERHRERTHWNPYVFLGIPASASLADPRPQWLPGPLLSAWDAATRAAPLGAPLVACLAGAVAMAWLARALWGAGPHAMAIAGWLWLLAPGLVVPFAFGHDAQTVTAGLIPLAALAAVRAMHAATTGGARGWALLLAFTLASQVVGGHPQFVVIALAFVAPLAAAAAWRAGRPARLLLAGAAAGLAAAMSAAVWLPALLYGAHTLRALDGFAMEKSLDWSIAPRDLLSLAWPHAMGFGGAAYRGGLRATDFSHTLGLAGFALACGGVIARGPGNRTAALLAAIAAAAALLALGPRLPVAGPALMGMPPASLFRTPVSWLLLVQLAGALLAARGCERMFRARPRRFAGAWRAAVAAGVAVPLLAIGWPLLRGASGRREALSPAPATALARAAARSAAHRAFPGSTDTWFSNAWVSWRARQPGGLHGAAPRSWEEAYRNRLFQADGFARACAMRFADAPESADADTERFARNPGGVLERRAPLGRAYAVGHVAGVPDLAAMRRAAWDTAWDPVAVAYVAGAGERTYPGSRGARIGWERDDPDRLVLRVRATGEAFVVIADAFMPGWTATLDGARVPIARVNHLLRGVAVPAGEHRLEMRYVPPGSAVGVALARSAWSLFVLAGVAAACAACRRRVSTT